MYRPSLPTGLVLVLALSGCTALSDHLRHDGPTLPPRPVFRVDEDLNRLTVMSSPSAADWGRLEVRVARCSANGNGLVPVVGAGGAPWMNEVARADSSGVLAGPSAGGGCGPPESSRISPGAIPLVAGDYMDFCTRGAATQGVLSSVEVQLVDVVEGGVLDGYIFADFAPC